MRNFPILVIAFVLPTFVMLASIPQASAASNNDVSKQQAANICSHHGGADGTGGCYWCGKTNCTNVSCGTLESPQKDCKVLIAKKDPNPDKKRPISTKPTGNVPVQISGGGRDQSGGTKTVGSSAPSSGGKR